jgi:hypothetical protein
MHHLHAELDPERGARVFRALDVAVEVAFHRADPTATGRAPGGGVHQQRLGVEAIVELVTSTGGGPRQGTELLVLVDEATLRTGLDRVDTVCETSSGVPLPVSTVRRLLCEATVLPAVLGGDGCVLDLGAGRRPASRAQRRALRAMYRTCAVPGCTVAFDRCEIHHLAPWLEHRRTDLADLAPLCVEHHHHVHDLGWRLVLDAHRHATWCSPDGTTVARQAFDPIGPCAQRASTGRHRDRPDPTAEQLRRRLDALVRRE